MQAVSTSATAGYALSSGSLGQFPESARRALMQIGVPRRWRSGQTLVWADEIPDSAFLVLKGRVRIRVFGPQGDERIVAWIEQGMLGALAPVLAGVTLPWDFAADGPCELLHFGRRQLAELLERDAPTALAVARTLSIRLTLFLKTHMVQSFAPLSDRVWAALRRLAIWDKRASAGVRSGRIEITQADLAHVVGASRYRVGLELQRLEAAGHVALARGNIRVFERIPSGRLPNRPAADQVRVGRSPAAPASGASVPREISRASRRKVTTSD